MTKTRAIKIKFTSMHATVRFEKKEEEASSKSNEISKLPALVYPIHVLYTHRCTHSFKVDYLVIMCAAYIYVCVCVLSKSRSTATYDKSSATTFDLRKFAVIALCRFV